MEGKKSTTSLSASASSTSSSKRVVKDKKAAVLEELRNKAVKKSASTTSHSILASSFGSATAKIEAKIDQSEVDANLPGPSGEGKSSKSKHRVKHSAHSSPDLLSSAHSSSSSLGTGKRKVKRQGLESESKHFPEKEDKASFSSSKKFKPVSSDSALLLSNRSPDKDIAKHRKRKTKDFPQYSPKKLRSSSQSSQSVGQGSSGKKATSELKAKTGNRLARVRNPLSRESAASSGESSSNLGSCASSRYKYCEFYNPIC